MQAKDALTKEVKFATQDTPISEIARMMKENDCGSIPVGADDKLVGMVTDRDIVLRCVAEGKSLETATAKDCMSSGILYCLDTDHVNDVARNMAENAVRRLPVVDKDKKLVGIISLGDISKACSDKATPGEAMCEIREAA